MKQTLDINAITPSTPNFIKTAYGVVPIADLPDTVLKAIAKEWGKELIKKAQERRANKTHP